LPVGEHAGGWFLAKSSGRDDRMRSLRPRRLKQERERLVPTVTAAAQFAAYRGRSADAVPLLHAAEPWSLAGDA
ncbi:MAG TPA: hypothetical protein VJO12_05605, partial [Stellaceae bacterium]|nr:hypothetical protein [Stellaceae bacterium]